MLVGDDLTTSDNKLPVVAAAHAIWTRTHGKPGPGDDPPARLHGLT